MPNRRDALKGGAAFSSILLAACSGRDGTATSDDEGTLGPDDLTPLERKFGLGPGKLERDGDNYMKVRSDLHLVEAGPAAIRSVSSDGLAWMLDPRITGPIEVGRVMFVTNRCAGRVLATRPAGDQVEVVFGPAELTDYIEEAKISTEHPIDFSSPVVYEAPDYPGAVTRVGGAPPPAAMNDAGPRASHAIYRDDHDTGQFLPVQDAQTAQDDPSVAADPQFKVTPFYDLTTLGVQIRSTNNTIEMVGDARLRFSGAKITFDLLIESKKLITALVRVHGTAALLINFSTHSNHGVNGNIRTRHYVPYDCQFPIAALRKLKLPFATTIRNVFMLQTAFSSKGDVNASGQYAMEGGLEISFGGGGLEVGAPTNFAVQRSLAKSVAGVTMGPAGLILTHQIRAIAGIGAFGFVTGPYVGVTSTAAVTKASSGGMTSEQCRETTFRMSIHGGIGYQIPESVVNVINKVLGIFHIKGIPSSGGISTPDKGLISTTEHYPSLEACRAAGTST